MKFIEDIKKLILYIQSKNFNTKSIFNIIITILSTFYHFLDNLVLLSNIGLLEANLIEGLNWKTGKNFFSFLKSVFKLFSLLLEWSELVKTLWKTYDYYSEDDLGEKNNNSGKLNQLYFYMIEALMKILMRVNSLKLEPIFSYLNPFLTALFGVIYSICGLVKRFDKVQKQEKAKAEGYIKQLHIESTIENSFSASNSYLNQMRKKRGSFSNNLYTSNKMLPQTRQSFNYLLNINSNLEEKNLLKDSYFKKYYMDFNSNYPCNPDSLYDGIESL
jgi:hypothetical protein